MALVLLVVCPSSHVCVCVCVHWCGPVRCPVQGSIPRGTLISMLPQLPAVSSRRRVFYHQQGTEYRLYVCVVCMFVFESV